MRVAGGLKTNLKARKIVAWRVLPLVVDAGNHGVRRSDRDEAQRLATSVFVADKQGFDAPVPQIPDPTCQTQLRRFSLG